MNSKLTLSFVASIIICNIQLYADTETKELNTVNVDSTAIIEDSTIGSKNVVSENQIKIYNTAELINPYKSISLEPGVDIRFNDPLGMSISHKIRGKDDRNIGEVLEGLPLKGIGPGGGLASMVDIENIESISVEKGAIKADSGFGYGSDNGMVNMHIKRPTDKMEATLKQAIGSDSFTKSYMRVDSGEIADTAKFFISGSVTDADKWKGEGKAIDRNNFEFGASSTSKQPIQWEVYGIYNDQFQHNYAGLTYAQSQNLSTYRDLDYQTSNPSSSSYYDDNKQDFQTWTLFGKLRVPLSSVSSLTFRPYYLNDKGYSYSTSGTKVQDWLVEHNTYGGVVEFETKLGDAKIKLGYWHEEDEPPGPPTSQKLRVAGTLAFDSWSRLVNVEEKHKFDAPFLTYEQAFGNTVVEAGVKYLFLSSPTLVTYKTTGIGDVSYEDALSQATNIAYTLPSHSFEVFLPNIGFTHFLDDYSNIKASYGRNWNTLSYSGFSTTLSDSVAKQYWAGLRPEESDNFDLGYTYQNSKFSFSPTLFYSLVKHVGGSFYDPVLNATYAQNTAEAESYGVELGASYNVLDNLTLNAAATYNRYTFTTDIQSSSTAYIACKGHQHPNTPEYFGNISAQYDLSGYKITPIVRYVGKLYVDTLGQYSVNPYTLVDLSLNKEFGLGNGHSIDLSLSATNLLNKKYISTFSASEINIVPETTYTVGSPRALFASVQYKY
ncbi:MAG: TonB-dependent receptor [Sulfuricurvum sp.]|uniref:TonB-dependent receptor n=1 Tax=Sulfuricurvum sp. TaxID=2025608 RepID=UPI002609BDC6|nr:TonB-dependent receptor [Sulfuricurvum sp.]MDD2830240.1 TonB-dependent receptor [Sulfuricurvum sp.]MDD4948802.1 TonB-dependent receptor [Sulfuricurvum sp.]